MSASQCMLPLHLLARSMTLTLPLPALVHAASTDSCFSGRFTPERCCADLQDEQCWHDVPDTKMINVCCSATLQALTSASDEPMLQDHVTILEPGLESELASCIQKHLEYDVMSTRSSGRTVLKRAFDEEEISGGEVWIKANWMTAIRCVASLSEVAVAIDVFLGDGHSAAAAFQGLSTQKWRTPELFTFDCDIEVLRKTLRGRHFEAVKNATSVVKVQSEQDRTRFRKRLQRKHVKKEHVWVLSGRPLYPEQRLSDSALDNICSMRAPIDLMIIDGTQGPASEIWTIIEKACRPLWVILVNINIPQHPSWMHAHFEILETLGWWQLQARGHFVVDGNTLYSDVERRTQRVRAWSVFRRTEVSPK